jgi:hypothetical protein
MLSPKGSSVRVGGREAKGTMERQICTCRPPIETKVFRCNMWKNAHFFYMRSLHLYILTLHISYEQIS